MRKLSVALAVVIALVFVYDSRAADVEKIDSSQQKEVSNSGKVYVVYTGGLNTQGCVLYSIKQMDFQGIKCLKGIGVNGYLQDKTVYIPVDKISVLIEFDSKKEWEASVDQFHGKSPGHE